SHNPAAPAPSTLSLHDALPICRRPCPRPENGGREILPGVAGLRPEVRRPHALAPALRHAGSVPADGARLLPAHYRRGPRSRPDRSEEHTSELQSRFDLVCRLLL